MQNRIQITNRALTLLGVGEKVSKLKETENAEIISDDINAATTQLLARYNFRFATKFVGIDRVKDAFNEDDGNKLVNEYYHEYTLPHDYINLLNIFTANGSDSLLNNINDSNDGGSKDILILGKKILIATSWVAGEEYDKLKISYTHLIPFSDESMAATREDYVYPVSFCEAVSILLSIRNSRVIRNDPTMEQSLWNLYNKEIDSLTEANGIDNSQPFHINVLDPIYPDDAFFVLNRSVK